jgi:hypothetical protein
MKSRLNQIAERWTGFPSVFSPDELEMHLRSQLQIRRKSNREKRRMACWLRKAFLGNVKEISENIFEEDLCLSQEFFQIMNKY